MKYKVKVDDKFYEVELNDLHHQPIIALVNGETIEVWLESEMGVKPYFAQPGLAHQIGKQETTEPGPTDPEPSKNKTPVWAARVMQITAPIPGVIISIAVRPGNIVEVGQPLCVLEAMKMKNTIRSPRVGQIARVNVVPGQTVQHRDTLLEYADE